MGAVGFIVFVVFGLVVAIQAARRPRRCDVCDGLIRRTYYTWTLSGKEQRVCPNCNRQLAAKKSREAVAKLKR